MEIRDIIWLPEIVEKLEYKHNVQFEEVEQVFDNKPVFLLDRHGNYAGEDLYLALGRTDAGRYLTVVFIHKQEQNALVISARDMIPRERKRYGRK